MKRIKLSISVLLLLALTAGCKKDQIKGEWLIPEAEVFDGGPGKDGIPAINSPSFVQAGEVNFLDENELVVGFLNGNSARAYPHRILDWHEIINDEVEAAKVAITYCPLTGTATGWDRVINGKATTFGVSGLLYNSNLIPYDRETDSNWSQMQLRCVNGKLIGTEVKLHAVVETSWKTWKEMYPNSLVVDLNTGFNRNYQIYPYGDYRTNNDRLLFPLSNHDRRLPRKTRVLGIEVNGKAKVYQLADFGSQTKMIEDVINGVQVLIVGNGEKNFAVAFERNLEDGSQPNFSPLQNQLPLILEDESGSQYDVFGYARSGPQAGKRLLPAKAYIGYFFAWGAFYPELEIYQQ
ncbi:MAG: DUF3179 domain-containing protein [Bacteroidetes bacterium]|nr:MAG: DUF3179 domain-containing protein [Bacteroidota bacterium]